MVRTSRRLLLINPNTNAATTAAMVAIAQDAAGERTEVEGLTAPFGVPLITNEEALAVAARAVLDLVGRADVEGVDGVIIAAFGDPALAKVRTILPVPVTGIAEAGMLEAGTDGRPFSVVT
jgi:Asp/Glu/hydantoin racemase